LVSGITLDTFNRHADKVVMANAAQLINNIHTSFVAREDKFTVTPVFHVFEMYSGHQGATAVRAEFSAARVVSGLAGLSGSCSIKGNRAFLTVVNPDPENAQQTQLEVRGRKVTSVRARVLAASDIHARNTFDQPDAVKPADENPAATSPLNYSFKPASVTSLEIELS
jgi:alpha-N-arabinofuranosidase